MKIYSFLCIFLYFIPFTIFSITPTISHFKGAIIASALGDALGMHTEFKLMENIYKEFGRGGLTSPFQLKEYHYWKDKKGNSFLPYTDDTQLSIKLLESLIVSYEGQWEIEQALTL